MNINSVISFLRFIVFQHFYVPVAQCYSDMVKHAGVIPYIVWYTLSVLHV